MSRRLIPLLGALAALAAPSVANAQSTFYENNCFEGTNVSCGTSNTPYYLYSERGQYFATPSLNTPVGSWETLGDLNDPSGACDIYTSYGDIPALAAADGATYPTGWSPNGATTYGGVNPPEGWQVSDASSSFGGNASWMCGAWGSEWEGYFNAPYCASPAWCGWVHWTFMPALADEPTFTGGGALQWDENLGGGSYSGRGYELFCVLLSEAGAQNLEVCSTPWESASGANTDGTGGTIANVETIGSTPTQAGGECAPVTPTLRVIDTSGSLVSVSNSTVVGGSPPNEYFASALNESQLANIVSAANGWLSSNNYLCSQLQKPGCFLSYEPASNPGWTLVALEQDAEGKGLQEWGGSAYFLAAWDAVGGV